MEAHLEMEQQQRPSCVTTYEGKIVNLSNFESWSIEMHTGQDDMFQVKAVPVGQYAPYPVNLFEGDKAECQAYVRDVLAPQLDIDTDDPQFKAAYDTDSPKKAGRATKEN